MPYNRGYRNKRRGSMRRRFRGGYGSKRRRYISEYKPMSLYRQPMTPYKVRALVGSELKHSVQNAELQPSIGGSFLSITDGIPQGVLTTNRVGQWIQPVLLHGHIEVTAEEAAENKETTVQIRIAFFRWKEDTSVQIPESDVLMESTVNVQGPYKFGSRGKFDILWSKVITLSNDRQNSQFTKRFRFYLKLGQGPRCLYDEATPKKYQLFFFNLSNSPIGDEPSVRINTVFRYTDS